MRVTIFHNVSQDEAGHHPGFDGYQPGQRLVPVFTYETELPDGGQPELMLIAEAAFVAFNADPDMLAGSQRNLAINYRARRLRSVSIGDVVKIGNTALACDRIGFREVAGDLNEVQVSEPGTSPDPDHVTEQAGEKSDDGQDRECQVGTPWRMSDDPRPG